MEVRLLCTCASWRWFMAGSSGGASGASPSMSGCGGTEGTGGGRDGGEGEQRRGRGGKGLEDSGHGVLISRVRPRLRQIDEPRIAGPSRHASPFVAQIRFDLRPPQPSGARALPPRTSKGVMSWGGPPPRLRPSLRAPANSIRERSRHPARRPPPPAHAPPRCVTPLTHAACPSSREGRLPRPARAFGVCSSSRSRILPACTCERVPRQASPGACPDSVHQSQSRRPR